MKGTRALGETASSGSGQEMYRMSIERIVMPENKGSALKTKRHDDGSMSEGTKGSTKNSSR